MKHRRIYRQPGKAAQKRAGSAHNGGRYRVLLSTVCPVRGCGRRKGALVPVCLACYQALPPATRLALNTEYRKHMLGTPSNFQELCRRAVEQAGSGEKP